MLGTLPSLEPLLLFSQKGSKSPRKHFVFGIKKVSVTFKLKSSISPNSFPLSRDKTLLPLLALWKMTKKNINELRLREESLWKQKLRVTWLSTTDLDTRFFHASTSIRHRQNSIECLKTGRNQWKTDHPTIIYNIQDYFKNIFTSSNPAPPVGLENLFPRKITDNEMTSCAKFSSMKKSLS